MSDRAPDNQSTDSIRRMFLEAEGWEDYWNRRINDLEESLFTAKKQRIHWLQEADRIGEWLETREAEST